MADDFEPSPGPVARPFVEFRPLLRVPGSASDPRKLALASAGLLALALGWAALGRAFGRLDGEGPDFGPGLAPPASGEDLLRQAGWWATEPARVVIRPFASLFRPGSDPGRWARSAAMALWAVAVWGVFGGAIARIAAVQAATGRKVGVGTATRFALRKSGSLIGAPLTPMLAVGVFAAMAGLYGLLLRLPGGVGAPVAAALGFLPILLGLGMALILLGLALGWPLMVLTVAAEGEDAADALSRSYSYVNQRLVRYAAHLASAWAIGTLGMVAAILFGRAVLGLAGWGVALGSPGAAPGFGAWSRVVAWVVHGWAYSYFWSASATIYLILRRDVDGAEWSHVYLPDHDRDAFAPEPRDEPAGAEAGAVAN